MEYVLKPSLENITIIKIAVTLWSQNDVRTSITRIGSPNGEHVIKHSKWRELEFGVIKRVSHLLLPVLLKEKVANFVRSIGLQMLKWLTYHFPKCSVPVDFFWTPQGTIDGKRTAEVLIKHETIDVATRYRIACFHCLENDIPLLWSQIPEDLKQSFLNLEFEHRQLTNILFFWTAKQEEGRRLDSRLTYDWAFKTSARDSNKAATEYFLQKLTPREREQSLVEIAKVVTDADVLYFLLSNMTMEQLILFFKDNPC